MEAQENNYKHSHVLPQLLDVAVEGNPQEDAVLSDDDEIDKELADKCGDVLERLLPGHK